LGIVFIVSNVLGGGLNFYLGNGGWQTLKTMKEQNPTLWTILFLPYYGLTEFAPAITFAVVMQKYGEVMTRNQ
jgi:hypothetical protein